MNTWQKRSPTMQNEDGDNLLSKSITHNMSWRTTSHSSHHEGTACRPFNMDESKLLHINNAPLKMYRETLTHSSSPLLYMSETSRDTRVGGWVSYTTGPYLAEQAERQLRRHSPAKNLNSFHARTSARPFDDNARTVGFKLGVRSLVYYP
jgi:hypothetical protein